MIAQYNFGEDAMLFASIAQGYKGGGFNTSVADLDGDGIADTGADPETSIAYELGLKSTLLMGACVNGSVYFTDYESLQVQVFGFDTGLQIRDAGDAETRGFEEN